MTLTRFDNENFETLARLAVTKFLQHDPDTGNKTDNDKEYGSEDFDPSEDIQGINTQIWNEDTTRLLDFACGPALISKNFAPYVKQIVGVDNNQEMVDIYNERVTNQGISYDEMKAVCMDITTSDLSGLGKFNAAVCSMAYHHIHDINGVTAKIGDLLEPGGWYFVLDHEAGHKIRADMTEEEAERLGVAHHHGLSSDVVSEAFKRAGFGNIHVERAFKGRMWVTEDKLYPWADPKDKHTLASKLDKDGNTVYKIARWLMVVSGQKPM